MTAVNVRKAIQDYITAGQIANLNAVNRAPLGIDDPGGWLGDNGVGATSYIWLESSQEQNLTTGVGLTRPGGWKMVKYNAAIIWDWYALGVATNSDAWADALDTMNDAIKTLIRADPSLGAPDRIFSAGFEVPGSELTSITVVMEEPQDIEDTDGMTVHGAVVFPVYEQVRPGE